ncbi:hypothetical protein [Halobacillus litoralis]|nr:hypothetical protein [Halobacillus litoralis]
MVYSAVMNHIIQIEKEGCKEVLSQSSTFARHLTKGMDTLSKFLHQMPLF